MKIWKLFLALGMVLGLGGVQLAEAGNNVTSGDLTLVAEEAPGLNRQSASPAYIYHRGHHGHHGHHHHRHHHHYSHYSHRHHRHHHHHHFGGVTGNGNVVGPAVDLAQK